MNGYVVAIARREIVRETCERHGITLEMVVGKRRTRPIVACRYEIMWHLNRLGMSMPAIGRRLKRHHTTVLHGIRQHQKRIEEGRV